MKANICFICLKYVQMVVSCQITNGLYTKPLPTKRLYIFLKLVYVRFPDKIGQANIANFCYHNLSKHLATFIEQHYFKTNKLSAFVTGTRKLWSIVEKIYKFPCLGSVLRCIFKVWYSSRMIVYLKFDLLVELFMFKV